MTSYTTIKFDGQYVEVKFEFTPGLKSIDYDVPSSYDEVQILEVDDPEINLNDDIIREKIRDKVLKELIFDE